MDTENCSNHEFLLEQQKISRVKKKLKHCSAVCDMKGRAQNCVERHCKLTNKKVEQLYKVSSLCLDDHQFKQEQLENVGRFGRPDIMWSVNKLARSVTKWTQASDRRLARLIYDIYHICEKHGPALQTGFVSGLIFCKRS